MELRQCSSLVSFVFLLLATLVPVVPAVAQSTPATCNTNDGGSPPCYSNVPDVLNGKTKLLQNDDLIVNTAVYNGENNQSYPAGGNLHTTNSTISAQSPTGITTLNAFAQSNQIAIRGRLWAVDHDQVLSASVNSSNGSQALTAALEQEDSWISPPLLPAFSNSFNLYGASGDFLGDGYDQMVLLGLQPGTPGQLVLQALGAADPLVEGDGISAGTPLPISTNSTVVAVTAGVFTQPSGNPVGPERPTAQLAVLSTGPGTGLIVTFYSISPTLAITQAGSPFPLQLPNGISTSLSTIAIAAGRFTGGNHDQLAIAYPSLPSNVTTGVAEIITVDFSAQGVPSQMTTTSTGFPITSLTSADGIAAGLYLVKGSFNWAGGSDQLGVSVGTDGKNNTYLGVMSFNSQLQGTMGTSLNYSGACHYGLAAGNFDSGGFNLQLADTATSCKPDGQISASIYSVDPNSFAISFLNATSITKLIAGSGGNLPALSGNSLDVSLIVGDEQGRSLLLGAPEKLTVPGHFQPDVVLEVPPMHVDFVTPEGGAGNQVTNISVFPPMFNVGYTFSESNSGNVSRQAKTSYTYSTKETASEGASYGIPGNKVSVMATQAATQLHQNTVSKNYDTNSGMGVGFATRTVFDDVVLATSSQFNVYSYPVIGQCDTGASVGGACPGGGSPLYVQFSGPDNVEYTQTGVLGANEEFYQPVHEPGNIFSYPGSVGLLQQQVEDGGVTFDPLTAENNLWNPQTTSSSSVTWTQGNSQGVTAGSTSTHSFATTVSASGSASFEGFGASASAGFDYNDSKSLSTLNQNVNSFNSSTGIAVNYGVSSTAAMPDYAYQGNTLIYGQINNNVLQTDLAPPTTIQAQGYLVAAHTADMLSIGLINSGNWWKSTYNIPDIALNHPARWQTKAPGGTLDSQATFFNCPYGQTSSYTSPECTAYTPDPTTDPAPVGLGQLSFYMMKGLFITPGSIPNGPQVTSVQQGNSLSVRARIYNYSLANFPSGSQLLVQFYAQPWDGMNGRFLESSTGPQGFAPAIYLGQGTTQGGGALTPPLAFCGGATADSDPCTLNPPANYEDAWVTWDTTNPAFAAHIYWKIWVLAWVVDGNGKMSSEMPAHGLTSAPSLAAPFQNPYQVPIETYSNNLGIYSQTIAIEPPTSSVTSVGGSTAVKKKLTLGKLDTANSTAVLRGVPTPITVAHLASGDHIDSIFTEYFDGDPLKGGTLFDTQHIPHIEVGTQYLDQARFVPQTCGTHEIFVKAIPTDGSAITATASATFRVTDDPVASINQLVTYVSSPTYPARYRSAMLSYLNDAKRSFTNQQAQAGKIQMQVLLNLVEGGAFFVPSNVQQALAAQMKDLLGCL